MTGWLKAIVISNLLISTALVGLVFWAWLKPMSGKKDLAAGRLSRAAAFEASALWKAAALEYQRAAEDSPGGEAQNLWMKAGNLCYEKLKDYQCAAESYLAAKSLGKDFSADSQTGARLVESLKNLGKSAQADAWLNDLTALSPKPGPGDITVASIGERVITMSELKNALEKEPPGAKKNFEGPDGLKKYLSYYLFSKLLYQAALETGILDERANQTIEKFKEGYLSELYYQKTFLDKIKVVDKEVRDYYNHHPEEFKDSSGRLKKFDEVRVDVADKLQRQKALLMNDLWLQNQIQTKGIKINEQAFASSK